MKKKPEKMYSKADVAGLLSPMFAAVETLALQFPDIRSETDNLKAEIRREFDLTFKTEEQKQ